MAFHLYDINELYSNADGTIQFIELRVGSSNGESFWQGQSITATQGGTTHTYTFQSNLPSTQTANTSVLLATQGFAALGIVTPDFVIPDGFLFIDGATVNFAGVDSVTYSTLPTDGTTSLNRNLTTGTNSPANFAGVTGTVPAQEPDVIAGGDGPDTLTGTAGDDTIVGNGGDDVLTGLGGDDTLDGGADADTAVYSGNWSAYTLSGGGAGVSGPDGTDTLAGIERLQFADKQVAIDLSAGQAAGNTVRVIGAAFDAPTIALNPNYVGIGLQLFDSGMSMLQVCQLVIGVMGNPTNEAFVNTVYQNVVGSAPSDEVRASYVGLLQGSGGTMTQAELLVLAANSGPNATNINLVGLQQSGVEFV